MEETGREGKRTEREEERTKKSKIMQALVGMDDPYDDDYSARLIIAMDVKEETKEIHDKSDSHNGLFATTISPKMDTMSEESFEGPKFNEKMVQTESMKAALTRSQRRPQRGIAKANIEHHGNKIDRITRRS